MCSCILILPHPTQPNSSWVSLIFLRNHKTTPQNHNHKPKPSPTFSQLLHNQTRPFSFFFFFFFNFIGFLVFSHFFTNMVRYSLILRSRDLIRNKNRFLIFMSMRLIFWGKNLFFVMEDQLELV